MSGQSSDWTPAEPSSEPFMLPELHIKSINHTCGMDPFPTEGPGGRVFQRRPEKDELLLSLKNPETGAVAEIFLQGHQVEPFMKLILPVKEG